MLTESSIKLIATYGAYGIATGLIVVVFSIVRYMMTHVKQLTDQASREREIALKRGDEQGERWRLTINQIQDKIRQDSEENKEAHRHERIEHEKLISQSDKILDRLEDMRVAFARMNGYHKNKEAGG